MPTFEFTGPDGRTYSVDGPEGSTSEQAFKVLQQQMGSNKAPSSSPAPAAPSVASDVGTSVASGLAKGAATAIGLPGDVASLAHAVAPQSVVDKVKSVPGANWLYQHLPTSEAVTNAGDAELVNYQPQTAAGRYTKAVAANAGPGLVTGLGAPAVVGGGVAGQAAYDATGSHLAEAGANIAGSIATPLALARAARVGIQPLKNADEVKAAANAAYANPVIRESQVTPEATQMLAAKMREALNGANSRFAPAQAPAVHGAVDSLAAAGAQGSPVGVEDIHSLRKTLGGLGRQTQDFKPTEQAVAAGTAKRALDKYLNDLPAQDVVTGDAAAASRALKDASANWAAQSGARKFEEIIDNASVANDAAGSAMNLGNKVRQNLVPLLKNDAAKLRAMGQGDDFINAVTKVNQGDTTTNMLRRASNMLGGGGGIGASIIGHGLGGAAGGAAGYQEGGASGGTIGAIAGAALGTVPGHLLRSAANKRTLAAAKALQDRILAQAPANAPIIAQNEAARAANRAAVGGALGQGMPATLLQLLGLRNNGG